MMDFPFHSADEPATIPGVVARHAATTPDKPFLILEREGRPAVTLSYAALLARAQSYAAAYQQSGLSPGAMVVIMLVSHHDLAPAFLGAMLAGVVPSIFPPPTPKQDPALFWRMQADVFARIGIAALVTDAPTARDVAAQLPDFDAAVIDVDATPDREWGGRAAPAPDGIAFLQHSSGTTGTKKGVILTHAAVLDFVDSLGAAVGIGHGEIIASWLPLYHDMGLIGCLVLPMVQGVTVVQMDPFEWVARPAMLLQMIQRHRASLCWMPNFAFHHIMRTVPDPALHDLSSMRAFIDCSEPCKPDTLAMFAERFGVAGLRPTALQVSYGMAENVFIATQTDMSSRPPTIVADMHGYSVDGAIRPPEPGSATIAFVSVGAAIPRTELRIIDDAGSVLPENRVGQVAVRSPYLFTGYHGRPFPSDVLVDGWYLSGDLGFMAGGQLYIAGRKDDLLIVNGRNVYAHDVEYAINQATSVKPGRCVAIGPFNPRLGSQSLVVIAETASEDGDARKALGRTIRTLIQAGFGVAPFDVQVAAPGWLLKTTSGKISRGANTNKYLAENKLG